jgi:hypothetical protein
MDLFESSAPAAPKESSWMKFSRRVFNQAAVALGRFLFPGANIIGNLPAEITDAVPTFEKITHVKAAINGPIGRILTLYGNNSNAPGSIFEGIGLLLDGKGKDAVDTWVNHISPRLDELEEGLRQVETDKTLQQFFALREVSENKRNLARAQDILEYVDSQNLEREFRNKKHSLKERFVDNMDGLVFSPLKSLRKAVAHGRVSYAEFGLQDHLHVAASKLRRPVQFYTHHPSPELSELYERYGLESPDYKTVDVFQEMIRYMPGKGYQHLAQINLNDLRTIVLRGFLHSFESNKMLKPGDREKIEQFEKVKSKQTKKEAKFSETYLRRMQLMEGLSLDGDLQEARQNALSKGPQKS